MKNMNQPFFKKKYQTFLFFFLLANVNALLNFSVIISTILVEGGNPNILYHTIFELTGSYSFFSLSPLMIILFNKLPLKKEKLWIAVPAYFLAAACFGVMHTYIMFITRTLVFDLAGWGVYEYGYFPYRILMESLKLLLGFWIFCGIYNFFKINKERQADKLRTIQLEEELTKTRLQTLQSQLNPHFLFNTLNMISSTMYDDIKSADKMIATLSDLLRITLLNSSRGVNRLVKEIQILDLYIEIMKARFKDKLEVDLRIDSDTSQAFVPNFIFQPLVENSIKYGMENLKTTRIEISSQKISDRLIIKIRDNGPGIQKETSKALSGGVGLSNTIERLEKLYGNDYEFNLENMNEGGLLLTIKIPFTEKE